MIRKHSCWWRNNLLPIYPIILLAFNGCTNVDVDSLPMSATLNPTGNDSVANISEKIAVTNTVQSATSDKSPTLPVIQIEPNPTITPIVTVNTATNVSRDKDTATATLISTEAVESSVVPITATPTSTLVPTQFPTPDEFGDDRVARVPILMYHYIEPLPNYADNIRVGLTVHP